MRKRTRDILCQGGVFIDPKEAGSYVWYKVYTETYTDRKTGQVTSYPHGTVKLGDCSRSIEWDISSYSEVKGAKGKVTKLNKAIAALTKARDALTRAHKLADKTRRKATKKKPPKKGAKKTWLEVEELLNS